MAASGNLTVLVTGATAGFGEATARLATVLSDAFLRRSWVRLPGGVLKTKDKLASFVQFLFF